MQLGDTLFEEARRQLNICNACRYCEGYCPVFPSLARRIELRDKDISHLANLCHDCRDCFYACMYVPPHVFAVNLPEIFAAIRRETYDAPNRRIGRFFSHSRGVVTAGLLVGALTVGLVAATASLSVFWQSPNGPESPYRLISYPALLTVALVATILSIAVFVRGGMRYWKSTRNESLHLHNGWEIVRALYDAAVLRYLDGGGAQCAYPSEKMRPWRRWAHLAVSDGFFACVVATISAAVLQDGLGKPPPYSYLSVPVISGLLGGAGLVVGTVKLLWMKRQANPVPADVMMSVRDYGLLYGLFALGSSGLLALFLRDTSASAAMLAIHLITVLTCIVLAPFSKFVHVIYRTLAIVEERLELAVAGSS